MTLNTDTMRGTRAMEVWSGVTALAWGIYVIALPDELKIFIEGQMAQQGIASASEYFASLVRREQRQNAARELEERLREGLQGPSSEMTREDWDSIRREALEGLAGEALRP